METMNLLSSRKSIRKYTGEPISDQQLQTILKAAMLRRSVGQGTTISIFRSSPINNCWPPSTKTRRKGLEIPPCIRSMARRC